MCRQQHDHEIKSHHTRFLSIKTTINEFVFLSFLSLYHSYRLGIYLVYAVSITDLT